MSFCFGTFRLQTAEKSRGWLEIRRFLDQTNRLGASYFWKKFRTNETYEKFSNYTGIDPKPLFFSFETRMEVIMNVNALFPLFHFHFDFEFDDDLEL